MKSQRLQEAIAYRQKGQFEDAGKILFELYATEPNDPIINYQLAYLHDSQGKESAAVPYYEKAIHHGLPDEELSSALLGLGSTYRCLGRYDDAVRTLRKGAELFPDERQFPVFLAMALYNCRQHHEAMSLLLKNLIETSNDENITGYRNALLFYHDKLDQTWD